MPMTRERKAQWEKEHLRQYRFNVSKVSEQDLIDYIDTFDSVNGKVKELIREDMEKNKS